jgi:hypothetical protein
MASLDRIREVGHPSCWRNPFAFPVEEVVDLLEPPPRRFAPPLLARRGDRWDLPLSAQWRNGTAYLGDGGVSKAAISFSESVILFGVSRTSMVFAEVSAVIPVKFRI